MVNFRLLLPLIFCIAYLNIFFLWTSHVSRYVGGEFNFFVNSVVYLPFHDNLSSITFQSVVMLDFECLFFLMLIGVLSFFAFKGRILSRILNAIMIMTLSVMPLGIEIYIFDRNEFFIHVTYFQEMYFQESVGIGRELFQFSNADMFFVALGVFVASSSISSILRQPKHRFRDTPMISKENIV